MKWFPTFPQQVNNTLCTVNNTVCTVNNTVCTVNNTVKRVKPSMARSLPVENLLPQNVGSIIYLQ